MSTTALSIITGGLLNINSYSPGQTLDAADAQVALDTLNDLTDSLNNDEAFVYTQQEMIFPWVAGQFQYTVGNPLSPTTFVGNLTSGAPFITGITSIPSNLVVGATVTDYSNQIPAGTTVVALFATSVQMSANAIATPPNPDTISYTLPGNIPIARPLRFRSGFTRANTSSVSSLDYSFEFTDFDNYKRQLLKNVQGPWPYIAAWQPNFPYGLIYVYPAPGSNYTAHIFSDVLLPSFASTTSAYSLPPGYTRALKKLLAMELCPIYGKMPSPELRKQAKEAYDLLKSTNSTPVPVMQFDSAISRSQVNDASWIMDGGFR